MIFLAKLIKRLRKLSREGAPTRPTSARAIRRLQDAAIHEYAKSVRFIYISLSAVALLGCSDFRSQFEKVDPPEVPVIDSPRRARPVCYTKQSDNEIDFLEERSLDKSAHDYVTPTEKVSVSEWPPIDDDLDFENLDLAIDRQLQHFAKHPPTGTIQLGEDVYPLNWAIKSLEQIKKMVDGTRHCIASGNRDQCLAAYGQELKAKYAMYQPKLGPSDPRYGQKETALFTGYYTPLIHTTTAQSGKFSHPVYGLPSTNRDRTVGRVQIDFENRLAGKGLELYYGADIFELYIAHIQGSAHVVIDGDKSAGHFLNYAGTNAQHFQFISHYMVEKGYIKNDSIAAQREF